MSQTNLAKCFDVHADMKKFLPREKGYLTKALHAGQGSEKWSSLSNVPPIHLSSTYKIDDIENIVSDLHIQNLFNYYVDVNNSIELDLQSLR